MREEPLHRVGAVDPGGLDQVARDVLQPGIDDERHEARGEPDVGERHGVEHDIGVAQPGDLVGAVQQADSRPAHG